MSEIYYIIDVMTNSIGYIDRISDQIVSLLTGLMVIALIPLLLDCFFGYKLLKFTITLSGVCTGIVLGLLIGLTSQSEGAMIVAALLLALLCGFIAFKLYKFGMFMKFWLLGTVVFAVIFVAYRAWRFVGMSFVFGLTIGALALVLHKGFVIITTAISGGLSAGIGIGILMDNLESGAIIGIVLALFGAILQFTMDKRPSPNGENHSAKDNTGYIPIPKSDKSIIPKVSKSTSGLNTVLSKITPDYYCPKSKLLIESITLPSVNKGRHACHRAFSAIFALFALAGTRPPASQKPKIPGKSIADRCGAVLPEQKCVQTRKDPQGILAVLPRGLTQYGRISARQNRVCPCRLMVSKDNENNVYADLHFENMGSESIIAVFFKLIGYNIVAEPLGEEEYSTIDVLVAPDTGFDSGPILLFDNTVRRVRVEIMKVVDSEQQVYEFTSSDTIAQKRASLLTDVIDGDLLSLANLKEDEKYLFTPLEDGFWVCTCGHIGYRHCSCCGRTAEDSIKDAGDVMCRIDAYLDDLIRHIGKCKWINGLNGYQTKVEAAAAALSKNNDCSELLAKCDTAAALVNQRKQELDAYVENVKRKGAQAVRHVTGLFDKGQKNKY